MKKPCIHTTLILLIAGTLLTARGAFAYTLAYTGLGFGQNVNIKVNGVQESGFAGQIGWQFTGSAGTPAGYNASFYAYCVNLMSNVQTPMEVALRSSADLTRNGNNPNTGPKAAWLFNAYASQASNNVAAAALQIAIWETLYDSTASLNSGYFQLVSSDTALNNQVNAYLTAVNNATLNVATATWFQPTNPVSAQDMLGAGISVPEPGVFGLLASSGLSGFCLLRRRKTR